MVLWLSNSCCNVTGSMLVCHSLLEIVPIRFSAVDHAINPYSEISRSILSFLCRYQPIYYQLPHLVLITRLPSGMGEWAELHAFTILTASRLVENGYAERGKSFIFGLDRGLYNQRNQDWNRQAQGSQESRFGEDFGS